MTSGTKITSRYHPDYPAAQDLSQTPNRAFAYNGAYRVRLLMLCTLTEPTREPDHPALQHRFAPTTGSLERQFAGRIFRQSLYKKG